MSITYRLAPAFRAPAQMDDVQRAVRWLRKNAESIEFHRKPQAAVEFFAKHLKGR